MIVVDANVALKWFLPEPGMDAALSLIGSGMLFAPSLLRIEVLSGITRCVRTGSASKEDSLARCKRWCEYLDDQIVEIISDTVLLDEAVTMSMAIKHALKDCLYLAAAKSLGARLVTADRVLFERSKKAYRNVELLAGCEGN